MIVYFISHLLPCLCQRPVLLKKFWLLVFVYVLKADSPCSGYQRGTILRTSRCAGALRTLCVTFRQPIAGLRPSASQDVVLTFQQTFTAYYLDSCFGREHRAERNGLRIQHRFEPNMLGGLRGREFRSGLWWDFKLRAGAVRTGIWLVMNETCHYQPPFDAQKKLWVSEILSCSFQIF